MNDKKKAREFFPSNLGGGFDSQRRAHRNGELECLQVEQAEKSDGFVESFSRQHLDGIKGIGYNVHEPS